MWSKPSGGIIVPTVVSPSSLFLQAGVAANHVPSSRLKPKTAVGRTKSGPDIVVGTKEDELHPGAVAGRGTLSRRDEEKGATKGAAAAEQVAKKMVSS